MNRASNWEKPEGSVRLFLAGDVMTGRAIDQLFPLHNPIDFGKPDHIGADKYLSWSAQLHGAELLPLRHDYVWGTALGILEIARPDLRLGNLEVAVTQSNDWASKTFNFRMHPGNIECLSLARFDCVALANNHVLDFGHSGLADTIATLDEAGIGHCGAGADRAKSRVPFIIERTGLPRIVIHAWGMRDSGIPQDWAAGPTSAGVNLLPTYSDEHLAELLSAIHAVRQKGDLTIVSLHWGRNWVTRIPEEQRRFARQLIDQADVDLIHGHSSHHPLPAETYRGRLILYGCGDLINDYEGHPKRQSDHPDLAALYFIDLAQDSGRLLGLRVVPMQRRRFRLEAASAPNRELIARQCRIVKGGEL